ncbi:MAG: aminotransferase class IV family protein [Spirochaetes bacterium]|uniref:branched-chain-amino-acid transaminase n=1 Tax=Candidatus Ornithospirochaeta stercoripullorum TaxID=2840899 RepID=A0A9D9E375_9SPIO|nr:aminotransferase class IV family protein [Candidatus Ornithospirochaeta stercoripullorum]
MSDKERKAIKNGEIINESEAVLPVTSREVQYSFSVYEALRIIGGHIVHLSDHLKRLSISCRDIALVHPFSDELIAASLDALIEADNICDATARILIVGGPSPLFFVTYTDLLSYPDSYYDEGVALSLYYGERFLPEAKTSNLLMQYIALEQAKKAGCFEALLVNRKGQVLEGTRSNFYGISGSRIYTAPDEMVLSGITRISVLKAASELGFEIVYTPPTDTNLYMFDSLFISSTSMGAMPVDSVAGNKMRRDRWDDIKEICRLERQWE